MHSALHQTAARQRGAAALLVVVILFFILAMVAAYAGRNLIFEQRTSVNNQRSVQALEVAEAGLEYTISSLAGGRVDAKCVPTADVARDTFRERYLTQDANGWFAANALLPTCMLLSTGPDCSCPTAGAPALIEPVGLAPTFRVGFNTTGIAQAGIVRVVSTGCSSIGSQCYAGVANNADAVAEVSVLLGLNSALATPPVAPLVLRGALDANNGALSVTNADVATRGVTIDAGGALVEADNLRLNSSPGSPSSASVLANDTTLSALTADRMFVSVFGMDRTTYRSQPAAIRVVCAGDCSTAILQAASGNPGRVIWVQGPVTIASEVTLGGPGAPPVMLIVQGDLSVSANLTMNGALYLHDPSGATAWTTNAGTTLIHGAVIAEGNLSVTGAPAIVFNPGVLRAINLTQGSMVRVPGSWRDFTGS